MTVFEKMTDHNYRTRFLDKIRGSLRLPDEEKEAICTYIGSDQSLADINRLMQGDYYFPYPRQSFVRKGHSNRRRTVYSFPQKESFLLKFMAFVLMDLDEIYADSLCSFRKSYTYLRTGKGQGELRKGTRTRDFFKKIQMIDPDRELYVLKTDFRDFGDSVDQDVLLGMLEELFKEDPTFFSFIRWLFTRNRFYRKGQLIEQRVSIIDGLPIGNFMTNVYFHDMDFVIEEKAIIYMRYSDDIAAFFKTKEEAEEAFSMIRKYADVRKESFNEKKTRIFAPGEEVEILGIQVFKGGLDIGTEAEKKLEEKLKKQADRQLRYLSYHKITKEEAMHRMIRYVNRKFYGYIKDGHELNWVIHAFPIITRTDMLKKLDHVTQDCIRICGSGRKTNAKYRIRYEDMVRAGYRSLVHAFYHGYAMEEL